ncbi:TrkH family potassium uptake protein [Mesomycoplasma lagogenitalium]|uniref:Potassium transporter TrkG n=1 Tax=Mesomycoplasma lagogenitalium TaxID=171286 RepID=A0ABY8LSU7_9BACT|nr:potassium transporter TrkG [Mesomycoplasma lagogenitalium]WGI36334.1 potassium transporter TrkG [Mesomycoplasma lagogenitalium]
MKKNKSKLKNKKNLKSNLKNINEKIKFFFIFLAELKYKFNKKVGKIGYLFITYFLITIIGSLLLYSNFSQTKPGTINYIDSLFASASAFSDTGLSTKITAQDWTMFGQTVIAILILVGGIGVFAIKVYIINYIFGFKLGIFQKEVLSLERRSNKIGELKDVIIVSITIMFILIVFSTFIFFFIFYFSDGNFEVYDKNLNPQYNFNLSLRFATFHSISALNNAGFDIIGNHSLAPYYSNYLLQIWIMILFIIGGIGYPVIYDLYLWIVSIFKKSEKKHKFSLFSKVSLITYFTLSLLGIILVITFETTSKNANNFWNLKTSNAIYWGDGISKSYDYGNGFNKTFAIIFIVFSTRSAGFTTFDLYNLTDTSLAILSILMFIGASPASTAGGIRSTTFAIIILNLFSIMRGKKSTHIFKRKIKGETVNQASIVLILSILLNLISFGILNTSFITHGGNLLTHDWEHQPTERVYGSIHIFFEVTSAFGTSGLTTGITDKLNYISKLSLLLIMFIGQLGISSTILVWGSNNSKFSKYEYLEEDIAIG